jgi:hypothetical protein
MHRILSAAAAVLIVALPGPLSAQPQIATAAARRLATRATAAIQGSAVNSGNGALANTLVRVRDARLGRIVDQSLTDKLGAYTFKGLEPGNYVVEIVSNNQTTLAATNLISANAGETVHAIVRLPFKPSLLGAFLGQTAPAQGVTSASSGLSDIVPELVNQLPQTVVQAIPAIVPVGPPVSER